VQLKLAYLPVCGLVDRSRQLSPFVKHRMSVRLSDTAQVLPSQSPPVHGRRLLAADPWLEIQKRIIICTLVQSLLGTAEQFKREL
jgi:hypothetical protein